MPVDLRLEGSVVRDIPSFYDEVNRVFMAGESWRLGQSLDALNDMLYGGYGALRGRSGARIVWADHEVSRLGLGREATIAYYTAKLARPDVFNADAARTALADLRESAGRTYFDIVLEIFADHPELHLDLA